MEKLPFELQRSFFTLIVEQGDLKTFECWLYQEPSLENYLRRNDYFELISLDFNHKFCVMEIEKIITPCYGLEAEICYLDDVEWILSKGHLEKIKKLAQAYYDDLVSHKIILLKSPNGYDDTGYYQDNRY